jgi:chemotaxis protein methyltransferase CheR
MSKQEIGIVDTRNVLKAIKETHDLDFKNHALTFFKRRLEHIMEKYSLRDAEVLTDKIKNDKDFFEQFLKEMAIETTELFRDPSLWRYLKDKFFPSVLKGPGSYKIWFPEASSGEELYSVAILLNELGLLDKVQLVAGSISRLRLDGIKQGRLDMNKMEVNHANFKRIFDEAELEDYYTQQGETGYIKPDLLQNTEFTLQNTYYDKPPRNVKLIMWRNQMLYFNQILQERLLKAFCHTMVPGGHMIIGMNEKIDYWNSGKDYILVGDNENVYKKRFS